MENLREDLVSAEVPVDAFATLHKLITINKGSAGVVKFTSVSINRPGLLLAGSADHFANERMQIIGNAEHYYLERCSSRDRINKIHALFSKHIPCVIVSRGLTPCDEMVNAAQVYDIPLFVASKVTGEVVTDLTNFLDELLAPTISVHGVLMEVSGLGVLLTGRTGMGKSETALELIHRGHRLVADDAVRLKKVRDNIIGTPPERIKHFMEIRGIGIIDIKSMFGVGSVLDKVNIDMVIDLTEFKHGDLMDRLGFNEDSINYLGVSLPKLHIPVMAGRNLAIVVEVACRNQRLKQLGFNALDELLKRCQIE